MYKVIIPTTNNQPELNTENARVLRSFNTFQEAREFAAAYYEKTGNDNVCVVKR